MAERVPILFKKPHTILLSPEKRSWHTAHSAPRKKVWKNLWKIYIESDFSQEGMILPFFAWFLPKSYVWDQDRVFVTSFPPFAWSFLIHVRLLAWTRLSNSVYQLFQWQRLTKKPPPEVFQRKKTKNHRNARSRRMCSHRAETRCPKFSANLPAWWAHSATRYSRQCPRWS